MVLLRENEQLSQNLPFTQMRITPRLQFLFGAFLISSFIYGQDKIERMDSLFKAFHANGQLNGNVLIAEKGKILYQKSFGYANEETKEKLNKNSVFELASCSKTFTAITILKLKEQGKLKLDDPISKYISDLKEYDKITIRHLLNHTSGLPDYMQLMDSLWDKNKIATNKDIVNLFSAHKPKLLFEPNTKFEYSNTGYALLALIIQKASGKSYEDFLEKNIFKPLKMKQSFVYNGRHRPEKINHYALGYVYDENNKKFVLPDYYEPTKIVLWLDGVQGDGSVISTTNDLLKWDKALYSNKIISEKSRNELFESATLKDGSKTDYGFGWFLIDNEYGFQVSHTGAWPGYASIVERNITANNTIIILTNHDEFPMLLRALREILNNKPLVQK